MNKIFVATLVSLIFLAGFSLRLYNLRSFPVGFHVDEAILGYTGYSLLLTGKDTGNHPFPMYTEVFRDYIPTGYHFLTILPIKIFGLNEFATRLPAAAVGSLTILACFFLTYSLFHDKKLSLLSSFLFAFSPWHIGLSRGSSEAIVALFFIVLGFALIFASMQRQNMRYLLFGSLILCLSYFFYHMPRLFVPIFFLAFLVFTISTWNTYKQRFKLALVGSCLAVSLFAVLLVFSNAQGSQRFKQVSIFNFPETRLVMEEQIREDGSMGTNNTVTRIFHNKASNYALTFIGNYLDYFTANFLFLKGGLPKMFIIPNMGLVYLIELPFFILGLLTLATQKKSFFKIPLIWLVVAPVVAALTVDDIPNVRRAVVMVPAIEMIVAYGFMTLLYQKTLYMKRFIITVVGLLFLFNASYFLHQYYVHAKAHKTWYRNNGFGSVMRNVLESYDRQDKIFITKSFGAVWPLVLFYSQFDPVEYQKAGSTKDREYTGFGKFYFVPQECIFPGSDKKFPNVKKAIYISGGDCPDKKNIVFKDFYREDGTRGYRVVYSN